MTPSPGGGRQERPSSVGDAKRHLFKEFFLRIAMAILIKSELACSNPEGEGYERQEYGVQDYSRFGVAEAQGTDG